MAASQPELKENVCTAHNNAETDGDGRREVEIRRLVETTLLIHEQTKRCQVTKAGTVQTAHIRQ